MRKKTYLTIQEIQELLSVSSNKTLRTTQGFPKPYQSFFDKRKFVFDTEEVAKFFDVDNLDEPFITAKEAAVILDTTPASVTSLAYTNRFPSYKLKHTNGSHYLFRKSELLKFLKTKSEKESFEGNTDYVNHYVADKISRAMCIEFIDIIYKDDSTNITEREYKIVMHYLLDRWTYDKIGKEFGISGERIRQLTENILKKAKKRMRYVPGLHLKKQVLKQQLEINLLRELLAKHQTGKSTNKNQEINRSLQDICIDFLNKPLADFDLPVRVVNGLAYDDCNNVSDLLTKYNSYNRNLNSLQKIRNIGEKSLPEIKKFIKQKELELEMLTDTTAKALLSHNAALLMQILAGMKGAKSISLQ
ncbi:MAG: helix-turn-helix domain-containing protein [Bacteroidia bacterium]